MIAIGILLLLAAVGTAAMAATGGDTPTQITFGAFHLENTTAFFFFAGALCSAVLVVGAWSVWVGYLRWRERGRELQRLRTQAAETSDLADPLEGCDRSASGRVETDALAEMESAALRHSRSGRADVTGDDASDSASDSADPFADRPLRRSRRRSPGRQDAPVPQSAGAPDAEART